MESGKRGGGGVGMQAFHWVIRNPKTLQDNRVKLDGFLRLLVPDDLYREGPYQHVQVLVRGSVGTCKSVVKQTHHNLRRGALKRKSRHARTADTDKHMEPDSSLKRAPLLSLCTSAIVPSVSLHKRPRNLRCGKEERKCSLQIHETYRPWVVGWFDDNHFLLNKLFSITT